MTNKINTGNKISKAELISALYKMDLSFIQNLPRKEREAITKLLTPKMSKYCPHVPTPKQSAFLLLDCKEAFYGGAAGGGKSDALLMAALQYVDVPGYSAILFRKTFADLGKPGALIDRAKEWLMPYQETGEVKWNEKDRCFNFYDVYGKKRDLRSRLQFGYLETANDCYTYQGKPNHCLPKRVKKFMGSL